MTVWETARSLNEDPPGLRWAELTEAALCSCLSRETVRRFAVQGRAKPKGAENPWMKN